MTRKKISPEEKMQIFRDTLDSYYVKNENEGFEYPDMEGDDLFFRGSEGEISKLISTLNQFIKTFLLY